MKVGDVVIATVTVHEPSFDGVPEIYWALPGDELIVRRVIVGGIEVSQRRHLDAGFRLNDGEFKFK